MVTRLFGLVGLALLTQPQQQPAVLTIPTALAEIVIVDAYVADTKGRPVTDLRKEDFELFEDEQLVPISAYRPPSKGMEGSPRVADVRPDATSGGDLREPFTLAVYVDRWLLSPTGRKLAVDQAASLAASHIAQGAQAVVIADDGGLRALTPVTRDIEVVRAALLRIQGWATSSPGVSEGRQIQDSMKTRIELADLERTCSDKPPCLCVLPELVNMVRGYASARAADVRGAGDRLSFLVGALGSLAGRKALVYVSDGLEQRPGIHLYDQIGAICPSAMEKDFSTILGAMQELETSQPLRETAARANAARVSLYPIDARGLGGYSAGDFQVADREYVPTPKNDGIRDANLVNPLRLLAEETGGFALIRGLDSTAAMKRFGADEQGHYVLGFIPGEPDGRTHVLRLRLTPKAASRVKAEIKHRRSYRRAVAPDRRGQRALATLVFGLEENALGIDAGASRTGGDGAEIRVALRLSALTPMTENEALVRLVVSFRVSDAPKAVPVVREMDTTFALGPEELAREGGVREIVVNVSIGAAAHDVVIGVEDVASGATSYLRRSLSALAPGAGGS